MSPKRLALKRVAAIAFAIALLAPALVAQAATEPAAVTGALTIKEKVTLGPDAVAVVVLVDRTAADSGGQIIGVQRIDAPGNSPISFSVPFDPATIQPTHAYAVFASLQDHEKIWQSLEPTPVITGGPTSNVLLTLEAAPAKPAGCGQRDDPDGRPRDDPRGHSRDRSAGQGPDRDDRGQPGPDDAELRLGRAKPLGLRRPDGAAVLDRL